jgi:hypothetical protein
VPGSGGHRQNKTDESDGLHAAAAMVFEDSHVRLARALRRQGVARRQADRLATLIVGATEGPIVLCPRSAARRRSTASRRSSTR